jgi:hypothetical protein
MDNRFQGLVVFLIGLSILLVAYTISQAETSQRILNTTVLGEVTAPTVILWVFGSILVIAGIIWGTIGDKFDVRVHWK